MALEEFEKEQLSDRDKNLIRMRSISNYVMGVLIIAFGVVFIVKPAVLKNFFAQRDPLLMNIMAGICILYGLFRIYRGYAQNYFK
ncbi:MAG: hypothetical protein KA319_10435 [Ferruginibacter sp.]|nr:hypothetical protein [Ferruginibacter sp.]